MATRKPRSSKAPDPILDYVLDGTGAQYAPTMTEILMKGTPDEVREFLGAQGALMKAGARLPAPVAEWLGEALEAICNEDENGNRKGANEALRVGAKPGLRPMSVRGCDGDRRAVPPCAAL
jgi:hypothetical protein